MARKEIILEIWNENNSVYLRAEQGEADTRWLDISLVQHGKPYDITGKTVKLYMLKPDNTVVYKSADIIDAPNGKIALSLTTQMSLIAKDNIPIELWIDDGKEKIKGIYLSVKEGINGEAIESTNELSALIEALEGVESAIANTNEAATKANKSATNADTAASAANDAAGAASRSAYDADGSARTASNAADRAYDTANIADRAAMEADTAAMDASEAARNANNAATDVSAATKAANTAAVAANTAAEDARNMAEQTARVTAKHEIADKLGAPGGIATLDANMRTTQLPSGTIPVSGGGTGKTSWTTNRLLYPSSSTAFTQLSPPAANGAVLRQNTTGAPYWGTPTEVTAAGIDSGSNANGDWIKFGDGTMIVTQRYVYTGDIDYYYAEGAIYHTRRMDIPAFPVAFLKPPITSVTAVGPCTVGLQETAIATTTGISSLQFTWPAQKLGVSRLEAHIIAIGRWK